MNIELVDPAVLSQAAALIAKGAGPDLQQGIALLLEAKDAYAANPNATGGKNCSALLSKALKTLHDNPFLALGLGEGAEESQVKKGYHKLALKYHPDKNKSTGLLFQTCLSAYNLLTDGDKRAAWESRRKKQEESLEHLRKKREEQEARRREEASHFSENRRGSAQGGAGAAVGHEGNTDADDRLREFNKKIYDEFRKAAKSGAFKAGATPRGTEHANEEAPGQGVQGEGRPQAPPRPKGLRSTGRSDTTVTLEWNPCTAQGTVAYELQWRERGQSENQWQTAQQLLLGTTCIKKNLRAGVCYEFRTRAASAWGWSGYSDPIMVLTAGTVVSSSEHRHSAHDGDTRGFGTSKAKEEAAPWTWRDGQDGDGPSADPTPPSKPQLWQCSVCRRENPASSDTCVVCFAKKDYKTEKLHNISGAASPTAAQRPAGGPPAGPPPELPQGGHHHPPPQGRRPGPAGRSASNSAAEVETDDEVDAEAWEFSDRDVDDMPAQEVTEDATDGYGEDVGYEQDESCGIYRLNTEVTKLHNVRAEPIKTAAIVGHLFADRDIIVEAEVGPWLKVAYHQAYTDNGNTQGGQRRSNAETTGAGTGWCLRDDKGTQYLIMISASPPPQPQGSRSNSRHEQHDAFRHSQARDESTTDTDPDAEYWYELRDDNGDLYYFNTATGASQWEPPEWFDEMDPNSGATYYRHTPTGHSQWDRPDDFVPVIRAEAYSTPEAEFIKNVLSPTRSFRAMHGMHGASAAADPNVVV